MNKVRLAAMHAVVMAVMAKRQAVADFMAQFRAGLDRHDVMRFQSSRGAAMLARVAISREHCRFPSQVFRAASSLILEVVTALRDALASHAAIDVRSDAHTGLRREDLPAHFTSELCAPAAALSRAVNRAAHERWRSSDHLAARGARGGYLTQLGGCAALSGAVPLPSVHVPIAVRLFGDDRTANLASLQPFGVRRALSARYADLHARHRAILALLIVQFSLVRIERYRLPADRTKPDVHWRPPNPVTAIVYIIAKTVTTCKC